MSTIVKPFHPGFRSCFCFLGLSLLFSLILVSSGSYGSFIDILMSSVISGIGGWLIWMLVSLVRLPSESLLRLQHMLSGGSFSLLLLSNINHPTLNSFFNTMAQLSGFPSSKISGPIMFLTGVLLGLVMYIFNSDNNNARARRLSDMA